MQTALTSSLTSLPETTTVRVDLDEDLAKDFNEVAGQNLQAQMVILQLQTNRHLKKLVDFFGEEFTLTRVPSIEVEEEEPT